MNNYFTVATSKRLVTCFLFLTLFPGLFSQPRSKVFPLTPTFKGKVAFKLKFIPGNEIDVYLWH